MEFTKLTPPFTGQSSDPLMAKTWIVEVEKVFSAGHTKEGSKLPLEEFQLKAKAHDW